MTATRGSPLPPTLAPRGLSREEAAAYVGVSPRFFEELVAAGLMPARKRLRASETRGRYIWDRVELDRAIEALPSDGSTPSARDAGPTTDADAGIWDRPRV